MDVAEASLIVFSVWVISAFFFALVLGRWFEMANSVESEGPPTDWLVVEGYGTPQDPRQAA